MTNTTKPRSSMVKALRRLQRRLVTLPAAILEFLIDFYLFVVDGIRNTVYKSTLPVTSALFSRVPTAPLVQVKDVRANRIRLDIKSSFSSPFNVDKFEVEWSRAEINDWTSIGDSDLEQRTVARLKADADYKFRVRAINKKGKSDWSQEVHSRTKIDPMNGGGRGDGEHPFTWEQTPTEVTINIPLPAGVGKRDLSLILEPEHLKVQVKQADGSTKVLLDGKLYGRVKSLDNGSVWAISKEGDTMVLSITLEKVTASVAPKFDYWRAIIPGHHEIDTHKISAEEAGTGLQMLRPGQYDPVQMRNMGVRGF